jgi:hypothetical protein
VTYSLPDSLARALSLTPVGVWLRSAALTAIRIKRWHIYVKLVSSGC